MRPTSTRCGITGTFPVLHLFKDGARKGGRARQGRCIRGALRTWAAVNLGLGSVTWPFLSLYIPGCAQGVHNDSVNGRFGYVFSLTRAERKTIGGETMVFQDRDLFRSNLDRPAAGNAIFELVEPRFNRLTLFDDRVPHAVQRVDGSMDPTEGRFVLHGHISEAGVITQGALNPEAMREPVAAALADLRGAACERRPRTDRLLRRDRQGRSGSADAAFARPARQSSNADLDPIRATISERIAALRFAAASAPTRANIPLIF